ncbi:MAG: hypothetical protein OEM98_04315 [Gammaproteobacteria bacterium]|nr:hypothetical protein [Gammaproteobacteria bacterium]
MAFFRASLKDNASGGGFPRWVLPKPVFSLNDFAGRDFPFANSAGYVGRIYAGY